MEVGQPGRWDSPLGGTIFSRVHMGKFCPGRWDVFCHVITGARIFERVNPIAREVSTQ